MQPQRLLEKIRLLLAGAAVATVANDTNDAKRGGNPFAN